MTTMAVTPAPLRRLFSRLDFALPPSRDELALVLEQWNAARGDAPAPRNLVLAKLPRIFRSSFVLRAIEGERDYALVDGREAAEARLGSTSPDGRLSRAKNRRLAVRLRRLFEEARRTASPFVAQFIVTEHGRDNATVEALVAPLSEDGRSIDSVLVALSVEAYGKGAPSIVRREPLNQGFSLFSLGPDRALAEAAARRLGVELAPHEEREFEDGEFKVRPLANVRNRDVYVVSSLYGASGDSTDSLSGADKFCRLLFFIGALKDAGADRVTVVAPYLCYQRKDRQTKPRDPVASRYVAQLLEAMGTNRVMAIDAHNLAAFQNAFRCDTEHLDAQALFAHHFRGLIGKADVAVVSPDLGGEKRAELFRARLERMLARPVAKAFMDKSRSEGRVAGDIFAGDVEGRVAIVLDDLISGGGTMARVAQACRKHGATQVWCAATHGVFSKGAVATLGAAPIDRIVITDTIPLPDFVASRELQPRLHVVSVANLVAEAIKRSHGGGSITKLLEEGA
jgi:ribose-phosphate pyrophosphokinase